MSQNDISGSFDFVKYASRTTLRITLKRYTAVSCAELNYSTPLCVLMQCRKKLQTIYGSQLLLYPLLHTSRTPRLQLWTMMAFVPFRSLVRS